jgi:hypothetical protein
MAATNLILNPAAAQNAATNALRDIKDPVAIANPWAWVWWTLAFLVVAAVLYWLWRKSKQKKQTPPPPPVPAHVVARRKLQQALTLLPYPREFCIAVSDTLRWYLEERFSFRAPERTTEEFLSELQSSSLLSATQKLSLGDFLQRCDLVKFAKYEPHEPELLDLHASASRLVNETEPNALSPGAGAPGAHVQPPAAPAAS